jgi:hypothetical protein
MGQARFVYMELWVNSGKHGLIPPDQGTLLIHTLKWHSRQNLDLKIATV